MLLAAAGLALGLVAAACGSDDSGSSAGTTAAGGGAATTAAGGAGTTAASTETPVAGGKLVMGIEADTGSPWEPSKALLAISGHTVIRSIYDSLTIVTDEGTVVPYLAESVEPNADYTVWTIKVRSGVTFHDGTPLNAAAVVDNLVRHTKSFLTAAILTDVQKDAAGNAADRRCRRPDRDHHHEAAVGAVPAVPLRSDRLHGQPDVAGRR